MATSDNLGMYLPTREDYISVKRDITDNLKLIDAATGKMDIIVNGNTASVNVTSGQYVTVLNSTITGITDGIYKAVANVAAGVAFVAANLSAPSSGALNEIVDHIVKNAVSCTAGAKFAIDGQNCTKVNGMVLVNVYGHTTQAISENDTILVLPENASGIAYVGVVGYNSSPGVVGGALICANGSKNLSASAYCTLPAWVSIAINFVYKCG